MELREQIARIVGDGLEFDNAPALAKADAILSIPEIRDALRYRNVVLASRLPDLPPDRVGELIRGLANRVED